MEFTPVHQNCQVFILYDDIGHANLNSCSVAFIVLINNCSLFSDVISRLIKLDQWDA